LRHSFENDIVLEPLAVQAAEAPVRVDTAPEKRVELHLHTTMSMMDALTKTGEAVATAARWGHRAIAITDHGVASSFPAALNASKNKVAGTDQNIKILYGPAACTASGSSTMSFSNRLKLMKPCTRSHLPGFWMASMSGLA